jgi:hypothetical protein
MPLLVYSKLVVRSTRPDVSSVWHSSRKNMVSEIRERGKSSSPDMTTSTSTSERLRQAGKVHAGNHRHRILVVSFQRSLARDSTDSSLTVVA